MSCREITCHPRECAGRQREMIESSRRMEGNARACVRVGVYIVSVRVCMCPYTHQRHIQISSEYSQSDFEHSMVND